MIEAIRAFWMEWTSKLLLYPWSEKILCFYFRNKFVILRIICTEPAIINSISLLVRPVSLLPWFPPVACGWTLIWLASKMSHSKSGSDMRISSNLSTLHYISTYKNGDECFPSFYSQAAKLALVHLFAGSKNCIEKMLILTGGMPHIPLLPGRFGSKCSQVLSYISCRWCAACISTSFWVEESRRFQ